MDNTPTKNACVFRFGVSVLLIRIALAIVCFCVFVGGTAAVNIATGTFQIASVGESATIPIVLDSAPAGVAVYRITVSLSNPSVATFTGVKFPAWATMNSATNLPAGQVTLHAIDLSQQVPVGGTGVLLATLTVRGTAMGSTTITITPDPGIGVQDRSGVQYPITVTPGTLTVGPTLIPQAPGYETSVVVREADQLDPAICGSRIVWQDWRNDYEENSIEKAEGDIYSYNLSSHLELPEGASTSSYGKFLPNDFDPVISDAGIFWVWEGHSDGSTEHQIEGRTLGGEPVNVPVRGSSGMRHITDLAIDGVRLLYVVNNFEDQCLLVLYDISSSTDYLIRSTTSNIRSPDIDGETIVWQEYDGDNWNIYQYSLAQGQTSRICSDPGDQVSPVTNGCRVVWADNQTGRWDLHTCDISNPSSTNTVLFGAMGDQTNPQIDGERVVWQDNRAGTWDIYMGNLSTGAVAVVCNATGDQEIPVVDGDQIVWQDRRTWHSDIYMFTVSSIVPTPVPTPSPLIITSPGKYSISADGYDGDITPIEIRCSNVVLDGGGHTVDGSKAPDTSGIRIDGGGALLSDIVIKNIRLTNWETGILADGISNSVIENCDVAHNYQGICLVDGQSTQIRNNLVFSNDVMGITVTDSGNTIIQANSVRKIGDGFTQYSGGGFWGLQQYEYAVVVANSAGTEIFGNDIGENVVSVDLWNSINTKIKGNQLEGKCGILSYNPGDGTIVADNVFENSAFNIHGDFPNVVWNVTPSPGPNIVGGPWIGGNFWATDDGTGFSETHPDSNRDGFCDIAFDIEMGGVDHLPLAPWSESVISTVPGGFDAPTSTIGNNVYDDVNGNGVLDFADLVLYFQQMEWIAVNEPLSAFDYNTNGTIDFADIIWLFNHL